MLLKKKIIFLLIFNVIFNSFALGVENKIVAKVNNEIITKIDVLNELNFLKLLNPNLANINNDEILEISKNTLIREKVKEIELLNILEQIEINNDVYEKFIESNYLRYGFKNIKEFHEKMNEVNVNLDKLRHKVSIEAIWSQLIFQKYSSKIKIDKKKLREDIFKKKNKKKNSFFLYEIVYNVTQTSEIQKKFDIISKDILQDGFETAAIKHSLSTTNQTGGRIGWIEEDTLNSNIKKALADLEVNQHTKPIQIPGGFIILYLQDKKETAEEIDINEEFESLINIKTNQQLNQFSNMHYQKVKKNIIIDEI